MNCTWGRNTPSPGLDMTAELIASELGLAAERCGSLLDELERNLFFLVRQPWGKGNPNVTWAFPVTVHPTPHRIRFSTGESTYGA